MKISYKNFFEIIIAVIIISVAIYFISDTEKTYDNITENYEITLAEIIEYYEVGTMSSYFKYKYIANDEIFIKTLSKIKFNCAGSNKSKCIGNKYLLIYSKTNPNNSIIDPNTVIELCD